MIKNITVLGAGTAGMLTALWSQKFLKNSNVTVVENIKKGVIGVGEATTSPIVGFLKSLDIDPLHMIQSVNGTIKNGISFENWNGDGEKFFHDFTHSGELKGLIEGSSAEPVFRHGCNTQFYQNHIIKKGIRFKDYFYVPKLAYKNRVDLDNIAHAFHFNAKEFAGYLRNIALERGVVFVDGIFKDVVKKGNGNIVEVVLEKQTIPTDFVFDCSGFSRLIIGGVYKQKWISYKKHLPMKCAIPFFLENGDDIKPYTSAIAMKNGWMWQTPLQDRIGAGYVFDSDYITPEEAKEEVEEFLGHEIKVNKVIPFDAGRFDNIWVNNCVGLGLSSNFIEPLESTSIHMTISLLEHLKHFINNMNSGEHDLNVDEFNLHAKKDFDSIMGFIYLHYITKRNDSKFWKEFKGKNAIPENLKKTLTILKNNDLKWLNVSNDGVWPAANYTQIAYGLGIYEKEIDIEGYENLSPSLDEMRIIFNGFESTHSKPHKELLKELKELYKGK